MKTEVICCIGLLVIGQLTIWLWEVPMPTLNVFKFLLGWMIIVLGSQVLGRYLDKGIK